MKMFIEFRHEANRELYCLAKLGWGAFVNDATLKIQLYFAKLDRVNGAASMLMFKLNLILLKI